MPTNVRAKYTGLYGQLKMLCKASKGAIQYEGRCAPVSDPDNYIQIVQSTGSRNMIFSGLPRGVEVRIQLRAYGPNGWSEWSDVVIIMVL